MRSLSIAALAAFSVSSMAYSEASTAATFGITPQVGLAGAGATVQWGFSEYLALSAGYTGFDRSISDVKTDDATYDADISLKNPQLFVNWAPFGGHFRLSLGVVAQNSQIDLVATELSNNDVERADVNVEFAQSLAPAFTLGWETPIAQPGFGYHVSIGAMYAGQPEADVKITLRNPLANLLQLQRDEERNIEDELSKYKVLPILQAGVLYRL